MKKDVFRPTHNPIMTELYDTFQDAADYRDCYPDDWIERERMAVYRKACEIAEREKLKEPTLDVIERYESNACGHVDYGRTWVVGIVEWMRGYNR